MLKKFEVLRVVHFGQLPGGDLEHAFAGQLLLRLAKELLEGLVEADVAALCILVEDRYRDGIQKRAHKYAVFLRRLLRPLARGNF